MLRLARENRSWGYTRIVGELKKLRRKISRSTVARILERAGLPPAPTRKRGTSWKEFLRRHAHNTAATDFLAVEVLTPIGLVRYMVLFVIKIGTREVEVCGIVRDPSDLWMRNMAIKLADAGDGFLRGMKYLIHDRDPLFTRTFRSILDRAGVECLRLPAKSPNLNAFAERFVLSLRSECLDQVIPLGEAHLRHLVKTYVEHYNFERPHQGLGNVLVTPRAGPIPIEGRVRRTSRLGGLLNSYHRKAA